jgi:hypothetical protein
LNDEVGNNLKTDYKNFKWNWLNERIATNSLGDLTSNMLFICKKSKNLIQLFSLIVLN